MMQINHDATTFSTTTKAIEYSTLLNRIFINYYESATASIALHEDDVYSNYDSLLSPLFSCCNNELRKSIINTLVSSQNQLALNQSTYPKGTSIKIRLQKATIAILNNSSEDKYHSSLTAYIKSVIEEYCKLSSVEREAVYYKNLYFL